MSEYKGEITPLKSAFFAGLLVLALCSSYYLFHTQLDHEISLKAVAFGEGTWVKSLWFVLSEMGQDWFQVLVSVVVAIVYYNKCHYKLSRVWYSSIVIYLMSGIFVQIIKFIVGRPRPSMWPEYVPSFLEMGAKMHSWPSGHTMTTFAWLACLMPFYGKKVQVIMFLIACGVSYSRIGSGAHYPSDVLSGAVIGYIFGMIMREKFKLNKEVL